jgi:ABC-2 type transport system ATP-binding protein
VIELEGLSKAFRRTRVIDKLSLKVEAGERVALIGANGAGKTTLIRCVLGEYVAEGQVRVFGLDPRACRSDVLRRIGFVPQLPPPLKMTVSDLVGFACGVSAAETGRVTAVAAELGLDLAEISGRPFVKLSGGQKQKLLIAIALGRDASLLILDEPTANLDPVARQKFFRLLAERRDDTMIMSSHRVDEVAALVTRVIEMDRGAISFDQRLAEDRLNSAMMRVRVEMSLVEPAFASALAHWGFSGDGGGRVWSGEVAGPDRLRFLCLLSHYAGSILSTSLDEAAPAETPNVPASLNV